MISIEINFIRQFVFGVETKEDAKTFAVEVMLRLLAYIPGLSVACRSVLVGWS